MMTWIHRIGLGAIAWWFIDLLLPFIPFGGLAFLIGIAYIIFMVLKHTLFKDGGSNTSSFGSDTHSTSSVDAGVRETMDRVDNIQM